MKLEIQLDAIIVARGHIPDDICPKDGKVKIHYRANPVMTATLSSDFFRGFPPRVGGGLCTGLDLPLNHESTYWAVNLYPDYEPGHTDAEPSQTR